MRKWAKPIVAVLIIAVVAYLIASVYFKNFNPINWIAKTAGDIEKITAGTDRIVF